MTVKIDALVDEIAEAIEYGTVCVREASETVLGFGLERMRARTPFTHA